MKITTKQLKKMIQEEIDDIQENGGMTDDEVAGIEAFANNEEQKYIMAFSTILGISKEEVLKIPNEDMADIAQQIRQAYQQKNMDVPPLNEPKGGWGHNPFARK